MVEHPVAESSLATVRLEPEAVERLGIATAVVTGRPLAPRRRVGGVVVAPPGATLTLAAPLAAVLRAPAAPTATRAAAWQVGRRVERGDLLGVLEPIMAAEARAALLATHAEAAGAAAAARVSADAAEIALARARRLLQDKAGSRRAVDEAEAQQRLSQAALAAAETRRDLLRGILEGSEGADAAAPLELRAPIAGTLTDLFAAPGQTVANGSPLCRITDLATLWVRAPVYAGDAGAIARDASAEVGPAGAAAGALPWTARPVDAPPAADPATSTVDVVYELEAGTPLVPGEAVTLGLPLRAASTALTVPWSAVLYDVHGGTWVYEQTSPCTYVRRRIAVDYVSGDDAALQRGPPPGAQIVTAGAAELFGTEFGIGK